MSLTVHRWWDDPVADRSIEHPKVSISSSAVLDYFGVAASDAGVAMSPDQALRISAVYRCVSIISGAIGSLPLQVFERTERGKRKATERPEYRLLGARPNPDMTAMLWRETSQNHVLLRGNSFSLLDWTKGGRLGAVWPVTPERVAVDKIAGRLVYSVRLDQGAPLKLAPEEILHVPALSWDGITGYNPIEVLRQPGGIAVAAERTAAKLFTEGIRGSGIMVLKDVDSEEAFDKARAGIHQQMNGNLHRAIVVGGNAEWKPLTLNPDDAQFLETRKFQVSEIARIFGLPPHMVGDVEKSTSWGSGIEQQGIGFVVYSLAPWLARWEQEVNSKLFPGPLGDRYFVKFNLNGLLRGDIKARFEAYQIAVQNGWMSPNDVLELEDMNTFEGGDVHLQPLNYAPWGTAPADPAPQDPAGGDDDAA